MSATDADLANLIAAAISVARHFQHMPLDDAQIVPLSPQERMVVRHVYRYPGISPSTLASDLRLQPSNASAAVRSLVDRGFIAREVDARDRRSARLTVTPTAWESISRVRAAWAASLRHDLGDAVDAGGLDAGALADAMERLDHALIAATRAHTGHDGPEPRTAPGEAGGTA